MFTKVGRRLALLNALVVIAIVAVTGVAILLLVQRALVHREEEALIGRISDAATAWRATLEAANAEPDTEGVGEPQATPVPDAGGDLEGSALETGDTFLFAFDLSGALVIDERGLALPQLPDRDSVRAALTGETDRRTLTIGDDDVTVLTRPVLANGKVIGAIQVARSLGDRKSQQRVVLFFTVLGMSLGILIAVPAGLFLAARAMRPIAATFAQQREFVSDASHELRSPLAVVRAQGELIQRLDDDPEQEIAGEAAIIVDEVVEMQRLVDDLLLLARLDERGSSLSFVEASLRASLEEAVTPFVARAADAGLDVRLGDVPEAFVRVDQERFRQVVRVLLDNAIRYTPAGGRITVEASIDHHAARISVRDSGIGIAPEEQAHVFDRFFRSDRARSRVTGGSGLGLSIAQALVRAQHGRIGVESTLGAGSTFWFTVPLAHAPRH